MDVFEKSQTVDPEVRAYVYSLVSALGGSSASEGGRYVLGDDALACLKDLKKWLRLYDNNLNRVDVKRVLSEANLVKGDLLEILGQWKEHDTANVLRRKVAIGSLEVLADLTWPVTVHPERATVNLVRHLPVLQLAQVDYKRAILHHESHSILRKAIAAAIPALTTPRRERTPRDEGIINLVLYLIRNVAMIAPPPILPSQGDDNDISRSETITYLQEQDVLPLILTICSGMGEEFVDQDVIILELLFHLLKGTNPKKIFANDDDYTKNETADLKKLLRTEKAMLASHARNAPSRHNRFGTMIWVKQSDEKLATMTGQDLISDKSKAFEKMDMTKSWNKPRHSTKKGEAPGDCMDYAPVHLDTRSRAYLKSFVSDFLDSGFNPLFDHLRRAIEREQTRVKSDHTRYFFYLISWFLEAQEARRQADAASKQAEAIDASADTPFAYIAGVLTQEVFALLNRVMQKNLDEKSWNDVHACLLAFTQIMLTVSAMSDSQNGDDQEIAENMQSRLFYEETTHDRILQVLKGYQQGRQDFPYLDACTELAHVFIRLLERYSKVNVDMYIRSKRRARKKAQEKPKGAATVEGLNEDQAEAPENEEMEQQEVESEARRQVQERKFDFNRFAARFVNEASINTFMALLSRYRDLDSEQLKRCHRFFYRVAFKMELPILLYRVDILSAFGKLINGPNGLDAVVDRKSSTFREWNELVKQVFRRCIKKLDERPELYVEMLFTKIPSTLFYLEHGFDKEVPVSAPRPPAELEVKTGMDHIQQIGVAVSALVNQSKLDVLIWVKSTVMSAIDERRSWQDLHSALEQAAAQSAEKSVFGEGNTEAQLEVASENADAEIYAQSSTETAPTHLPPAIIVKTDTEERRMSLFKDKHIRLLLKVLLWQRLGADNDAASPWIIPSSLSAEQLEEDLDTIRKFEFEPPTYEDGKSAEAFIRNVTAGRRNAYEKEAESDEEGDSDLDEELFVPGGPTIRPNDPRPDKPKKKRLRRRGEEITEEEQAAKADARRKRDKEKDAKIKSTLFVTESDDESDVDKDGAFFALEAARRGKAAGASMIKEKLMDGRSGAGEERASKTKKRKSQGEAEPASKKRRATAVFDEDSDEELDAQHGSDHAVDSEDESVSMPDAVSVDDGDIDVDNAVQDVDDTPLSSQTDRGATLKEVSGNARRHDAGSDDEDDVVPVKKAVRRGPRALFVDDDSD